MRIFVHKLLISIVAIFFLYHLTIGYTIYSFQNKIYSSLSKRVAQDIKIKIRKEIETSIKKDKILKEEDAILLNKIFKKLSSEIRGAD